MLLAMQLQVAQVMRGGISGLPDDTLQRILSILQKIFALWTKGMLSRLLAMQVQAPSVVRGGINGLSDDLLQRILSILPARDHITTFPAVCKRWRNVLSGPLYKQPHLALLAKCTSEARRLLKTQGLPVPDDMRPPPPSGYGYGYNDDDEEDEDYWEESEPSEVVADIEATDPDHPWFQGSELYGAEPEEIMARAALMDDPDCQVFFSMGQHHTIPIASTSAAYKLFEATSNPMKLLWHQGLTSALMEAHVQCPARFQDAMILCFPRPWNVSRLMSRLHCSPLVMAASNAKWPGTAGHKRPATTSSSTLR